MKAAKTATNDTKAVETKGRKVGQVDLNKTNNVKLKQITKSSMVPPDGTTSSKKKLRYVQFDSDVSFRSKDIEDDNPADDNVVWDKHETRNMVNEEQIDGKELLRDEMKKMDTKAKMHLKKTIYKLDKERDANKRLVAMHEAKVAVMDIEFEQQVLRAQVAQESEVTLREQYAKAKTIYHKLAKTGKESEKIVKDQQSKINSLERMSEQQLATVSGLQLHVDELTQGNPRNAQLSHNVF